MDDYPYPLEEIMDFAVVALAMQSNMRRYTFCWNVPCVTPLLFEDDFLGSLKSCFQLDYPSFPLGLFGFPYFKINFIQFVSLGVI